MKTAFGTRKSTPALIRFLLCQRPPDRLLRTSRLPAGSESLPTLTFRPSPSSISQEPGMGTMGLALPWKARIASVPRQRETRVEPSEHYPQGPNPAAVDASIEDAALAAGCRAGNLQTYERLYSIHGAR